MPERTRRLAIIGTGAMGQTLCRGLINTGTYSAREIVIADIDKERLAKFSREVGTDTAGNVEAASSSSITIIAVKPAAVPQVLDEVSGYIGTEQMVVSIAAGVTVQQIGSKLRSGVPVIRAMPNTPCLVGEGATAISRGKDAMDTHVERALTIFGSVGKVIEVPERLMDAVTGLSGSGPAYIYTAIEALADAGVHAGLAREQAAFLAAQTVLGAAKMVIETGKHPAELRDAVASPGGTTIAGIAALERDAFRAALFDAVEAAVMRSRELSQG
ncbi:MAG: pyrroline-5-carboxylate reductase [Armatimonadetes bacterium]|nr:pyrroline-5-carboxylate reductase [Armatimonadota bacterium]